MKQCETKIPDIVTNMTKGSRHFDNNLSGHEAILQEKHVCWYEGQQQSTVTVQSGGHNEEKTENDVIDEEWERKHLRYGWGRFSPDCVQFFNNIGWFVFWTSVFSLFQGFIVNGVINAVISTLEKRFELPSSKSGLIASSNDFLAFFLVLAISFYGSRRHKPQIIGVGVIVLGIGSFIFSLPHFAADPYKYEKTDTGGFENVCRINNSTTDCDIHEKWSHLQSYLYVFILANAIHGAGSTPMFTLGTTFIDENSRLEQTPFFLGIIYCLASLGVAAGYMGGGQFLNIYTDVDKVDTSSITITPSDPTWIGAWWIPFLIAGSAMFIVSIPLLGYPKRLPGSWKMQLERKSEATKTKSDSVVQSTDFGKSWRDFPKAVWNLILNPTYVCLCLGGCAEAMIISGMATFGPKFLQEEFNLHPALSGFIMGVITVPGAGGGMILGGFIAKKMKLKCGGIIRMNLIAALVGLFLSFVFLLQCPKQSIAGVTTEYVTNVDREGQTKLESTCNSGCGCSAMFYEPVCGDNIIYFTPCHAGCSDNFTYLEGPMGPFKTYTNCTCVKDSRMYQMMRPSGASENAAFYFDTTTKEPFSSTVEAITPEVPALGAFQGVCPSQCNLLYAVAPLLFVGLLLTFMTCSPTQTATMRCVPENQRSLAIGLQWLLLRLLGTTPGPLMLGAIMDGACQTWQDLCGKTGSCWIYEKNSMGRNLFIWWCCIKIVCLIFYFLAQFLYKPAENASDNISEDGNGEGAVLKKAFEELECQESCI